MVLREESVALFLPMLSLLLPILFQISLLLLLLSVGEAMVAKITLLVEQDPGVTILEVWAAMMVGVTSVVMEVMVVYLKWEREPEGLVVALMLAPVLLELLVS